MRCTTCRTSATSASENIFAAAMLASTGSAVDAGVDVDADVAANASVGSANGSGNVVVILLVQLHIHIHSCIHIRNSIHIHIHNRIQVDAFVLLSCPNSLAAVAASPVLQVEVWWGSERCWAVALELLLSIPFPIAFSMSIPIALLFASATPPHKGRKCNCKRRKQTKAKADDN